jgi:U3 small nucleolar RNA-associated protein 13
MPAVSGLASPLLSSWVVSNLLLPPFLSPLCTQSLTHSFSLLALHHRRWLVSSSKDRTVRLWDLSEGGLGEPVCAAIGVGHTEGVGCVCMSTRPNAYAEKLVFAFSASGDKIIKRWSLRSAMDSSSTGAVNGAPARQLQATHSVRGHEKDINTVALSPNDALLASGSQDKTIRIWKADDLQAVATLRGHKRGVWKVAFSSIDKILCSGSGDRTVRLWSMSDYSCLKTLEGHSASVLTVRFVSFRLPPLQERTTEDAAVSNVDYDAAAAAGGVRGNHAVTYNSLQVLSGSADGLIRLWDVRSGEVVKTFDQHSDKLWALSFPKDGGYTPPQRSPSLQGANVASASDSSSEIDSLGAFFVTAGSDARMLVWTDATTEEERSRLKALETRTIAEQSMDNDMRAGRFDKVRVCSAIYLYLSLPIFIAFNCPVTFAMRV